MADPTYDAGAASLSAREYFAAKVQPSLLPTCGGCHSVEGGIGPSFLKSVNPPEARYDPYTTISTWNNFVVETPQLSALVRKGVHEGPALTGSEVGCTDQCGVVIEWLTREAEERKNNLYTPRKPQVAPLYPAETGYTRFDLGQIDPIFAESYISFKATALTRGIELSDVRIFNVKANALATKEQRIIHFVRPLFVIWKNGNPMPDPVDNFAVIDRSIRLYADDDDKDGKVRTANGVGILLPPGLLTLTDFRKGDAISIVFNTFELVPPPGGENPCSAAGLTKFRLLGPYLSKTNGANTNCGTRKGCHTTEDATAGLSLTVAADATDTQAFKDLCERIKFYNVTNTMVDNTDPTLPVRHPQFKYSDASCVAMGFGAGCHADLKAKILDMKNTDP